LIFQLEIRLLGPGVAPEDAEKCGVNV